MTQCKREKYFPKVREKTEWQNAKGVFWWWSEVQLNLSISARSCQQQLLTQPLRRLASRRKRPVGNLRGSKAREKPRGERKGSETVVGQGNGTGAEAEWRVLTAIQLLKAEQSAFRTEHHQKSPREVLRSVRTCSAPLPSTEAPLQEHAHRTAPPCTHAATTGPAR